VFSEAPELLIIEVSENIAGFLRKSMLTFILYFHRLLQ